MNRCDEAARFPKMFAIARELVRTGVIYDGDKPPSPRQNWAADAEAISTFNEVLSIFVNGVGLICKPSLPKLPEGAPWKVHKDTPDAVKINELILLSLVAQKTAIRETEFWKSGIMSGDYLTVCGALHFQLKLFGVSSEFKVGIRKTLGGEAGTPVVWLKIRGNMIDNTYYHSGDLKPGTFDKQIVHTNKAHCYVEEDPTTTTIPLAQGQVMKTCVNNPEVFKAYATPENIGKYMWFRFSFAHVYPNFKLYVMAFAEAAMYLTPDLLPFFPQCRYGEEWNSQCWHCKKNNRSLKKCSVCHVARYCDVRCQKADWLSHKLLHKDLKANDDMWKAK